MTPWNHTVTTRNFLSLSVIAALLIILSPGNALAQQKSLKAQLVGTWKPVAVENLRPDGSKTHVFGPTPLGILIFSETGHFSLQALRPDVAKYVSNNRSQGTPDENKATVQGGIHFFGTYTVNEVDQTFIFHIEGSSFPNYNGLDQKRHAAVNGDELHLTLDRVSAGGSAKQVWKRVK
jgi:hypothetical protein